jgi:transcriptional regulator with XRE-family HTH domain
MSGDNLLGEFLQARRGRIRADERGLTSYGRRRVPGLRRDELARLAGVSPYYLTRLEQGRDRNPSGQVLHALATALRLDRDETAHLYALAGPAQPGSAPPGSAPPGSTQPGPVHDRASSQVQQLLDSWTATPAYVRNRRFDVLAANELALALSPLYSPGRNLVRGIFLDPAARALFPDWTQIATQTAAALRAEADPRDPVTAELISAMLADDFFRRVWAAHDVRPARDETKRFDHPSAGPLTLRRQALSIAGAEDQVIITYQAEPASPAAAALAGLRSARAGARL